MYCSEFNVEIRDTKRNSIDQQRERKNHTHTKNKSKVEKYANYKFSKKTEENNFIYPNHRLNTKLKLSPKL